MIKKTAIIIGATGLVGSNLLQKILADERFAFVVVFVRRSTGIKDQKLSEHIINFDEPQTWQQLVRGDVLFSALGTTLKQAESKEAQYKIDFTYQYNFAKVAAENGVPVYVLVSSAMANPNSRIFYTRIKGELEVAVKKLLFQSVQILQPGMLAGLRKEQRPGETIGGAIIKFLNKLGIAKQQKPIDTAIVAQAMINISFRENEKLGVYSLLKVFEAADLESSRATTSA
ncbi:MAG: NAD-dependent epimerase/dehydratase family protein [Bacteroidota bacterium]